MPCTNHSTELGCVGGRCPLLRLHQLVQLEVFFFSPGIVESVLHAMEFVGLSAVLFRVGLVLFFVVVVFRWCAIPLSKVLSAEGSTVFESLGAVGANGPHGRGFDKQWSSLAGRSIVAVDRDFDFYLPWRGI